MHAVRTDPGDLPIAATPWKVLIVDDEPEVHAVTRLVLGNFSFAQRKLEILSAYSGAEARSLLAGQADIAVLLLDVVMETEHAGLDLVRTVREELRNPFVRIVLRTGQAGQAPEREVVAAYDINDYKEKTELTASRLTTTMYSALRAYRDMRAIEAHRNGLEHVIQSAAQVFARQDTHEFANAVLDQLGQLVGQQRGVLYGVADCRQHVLPSGFSVAGAIGSYRDLIGARIEQALPAAILASVRMACRERRHFFANDHYVLHFSNSQQPQSLLFVGEAGDLSSLDYKLVELFCSNVSVAFENLHLNDVLLSSQREMVYLLASAAETRSQETAQHVRRVGLLAGMLGKGIGLDEATCDLLCSAAPLHDIGKIGIPDTILNKRGAHSGEEAEIMRTHAAIGARLLAGSNRPVMRLAAEIAGSHHENWDGSGYPNALAGEQIPISGRITMVADVFDALGSRRCYKEPWEARQIRSFMLEHRGSKFDPAIIDRLMKSWDAALSLRRDLPD